MLVQNVSNIPVHYSSMLFYFLNNKTTMWTRAYCIFRNTKWFLHILFENCNVIYSSSILFTRSHWILICCMNPTSENHCWVKSIPSLWWKSFPLAFSYSLYNLFILILYVWYRKKFLCALYLRMLHDTRNILFGFAGRKPNPIRSLTENKAFWKCILHAHLRMLQDNGS